MFDKIFGKPKKKKKRRSSGRGKRASTADVLERMVVEEIEVGAVGGIHPSDDDVRIQNARRRRTERARQVKFQSGWIGLWLIIVVAGIVFRHPWPPEETRTLALLWEAWLAGGTLPFTVNGATDTSLMPMLVWLTHLGWMINGVSEIWSRLLPGLAGLFSLSILYYIARRLWPEVHDAAHHAPLVMLGCFVWATFLTVLTPYTLVIFFVCLSMLALLWMTERAWAWLLYGAAVSGTVLSGGLYTLIYLLPVALLAPLWAAGDADAGRYYKRLMLSLLLAAILVAAAFAVPLMEGRTEAVIALLVATAAPQGVGWMLSQHPWWWYFLVAFVAVLPWSLWPLAWVRLLRLRKNETEKGIAFCLSWAVPSIALLMFFDIRQIPLLMPVVPAFALMISYLLFNEELGERDDFESPLMGMGVPILIAGGMLAILPKMKKIDGFPDFLWNLSPLVGVGVIVVGIAIAWLPIRQPRRQILNVSIFSLMLAVFVVAWFGWQYDDRNNVEQIAKALSAAEQKGEKITHVGVYRGEYTFKGRLQQPVNVVMPAEINNWIQTVNDGVIVSRNSVWYPAGITDLKPVIKSAIMEDQVSVWSVADLKRYMFIPFEALPGANIDSSAGAGNNRQDSGAAVQVPFRP